MHAYRSRPGGKTAGALMFLLLLCGAILRADFCLAAGALAVALPADVVKGGFSYGYSRNYPDINQAEAHALDLCRTTKDAAANADLRALCKVIQDFSDQCVAIAMDPAAGTPGVGWGIAANSATAQSLAMSNCKKTAGPSRRAFCKVDNTGCDGTAQ